MVLLFGSLRDSLCPYSELCIFSTRERGESKRTCNIAQHKNHLYITEVCMQIWQERGALRWDSEGRE